MGERGSSRNVRLGVKICFVYMRKRGWRGSENRRKVRIGVKLCKFKEKGLE